MRRLAGYKALALVATMLIGACSQGPDSERVYTSWLNDDAIGGYDVVSFYSGKPLIGKELYQTEYKSIVWSFSSRANLELFQTNPEVFLPQYGGHCAWAIANGKLAKGSPENWHVRDGRLFLTFNKRIQTQWERDIPKYITKADKSWPNLNN